ncbi:ZIP family metal transporter [Leptospira sp. GIMC2001]|uniref:ZIP family metal transporter n=1 Tax=Leptospira sp. GIMC2001 TaxID=1513297 RepID=UPI00234A820D|nr:ZIP family metal transporter [Leptospira sp. GIMC2001]WCL49162.1 ZIP family metal transporter [Leptospira sp. GIMC2001]
MKIQPKNEKKSFLINAVFNFHILFKNNPVSFSFLGFILLILIYLLSRSFLLLNTGQYNDILIFAMIGSGISFLATAIGALPAFFLSKIQHRTEDIMLGFSAGMMLSASTFSLIIPGLDSGRQLFGSSGLGSMVVVFGMGLGVALMMGLEQLIPHEHEKTGTFGLGQERVSRIWLFVFAIALHNIPEGMAIGVGFSQGDFSVGLPLTIAIALQNLPEGLAVAITLRGVGVPVNRAVMVAAITGLLEPVGAVLGVGLAVGNPIAYPIGLGLAGGAMIFVVSHEVIPETHRNGHQTASTVGLMIGFAVMMVLDTAFGG